MCAQLQGDADRWWEQLRGNDEAVVCEALNAAFSDNPAGGVALGVADGVCSVLIRQPDLDDLPTQRGGTTPTGKPTLRTLTQRDRHRLFLQSMVSNVAATLLEGFASAPGLSSITVCVLTRVQKTQRLGVVLVGRWTRTAVRATPWGTDQDAFGLVLDRAAELHLDLTVAGAARALSPATVPVVAQVLALAESDDGAPTRTNPPHPRRRCWCGRSWTGTRRGRPRRWPCPGAGCSHRGRSSPSARRSWCCPLWSRRGARPGWSGTSRCSCWATTGGSAPIST